MSPTKKTASNNTQPLNKPHALASAVRSTLLIGMTCLMVPQVILAAESAILNQHITNKIYKIEPSLLVDALNNFARQSGVTLSFTPAQVQGIESKGLQGIYTIDEGLAALLSQHELEAISVSGGGYVLKKRVVKEAVKPQSFAKNVESETLPEVSVSAETKKETATSHVNGYVAKLSMTATKDNTPIMQTSQSISVVTRDQMDEQGAQTITDALRYTAGVNTSAYGEDPRYDWITMRGFNQSVLGVYRDGLRSSGGKISTRIDSYGLERIEILKGPTSVLYGQNAPGGLVNSITKRPTDDMVNEVRAGVGSYNRKQVQFDVGGRLDDHNEVSYRLTGNLRDSDSRMDYMPDDHIYIAPALTWRPDVNTSLTLFANYQKDKTAWGLWYPRTGTLFASPWGQIKPSFFPGEPSYNGFDREQTSFSTLFEKQFDNGMAFRQVMRAESMQYDAKFVRGRALLNDNYDPDETGHLLYRDTNRNKFNSTVYAMDNQLNWNVETGALKHHLLTGLDISRTHYEDRQYSGSAPVLDILNPVYGQVITEPTSLWARDITGHQTGLYFQDRMDFHDWILRVGLRRDWTDTDTINTVTNSSLRQHDNATTYQAGILYQGWTNFAPFINYAQSFQPTTQASQTGDAFKPTKGNSVEAGVRYQPTGGNGMLTASVFDIVQNNVLAEDPANTNYLIQTGQVESRGLELEALWNLTHQLNLIASYTYLDAKVTKSSTLGQVGTRPQDAWGTTSPNNMASLWATYHFNSDFLNRTTIGGGIRYMGSTLDYGASAAAPENNYAISVKTPSYTVLDVAFGHDIGTHWHLQLNVNNLLNKLYVANPCGATQFGTCYYGPSRTALLSATYSW